MRPSLVVDRIFLNFYDCGSLKKNLRRGAGSNFQAMRRAMRTIF